MRRALTAIALASMVSQPALGAVWRWQGAVEESAVLDIELVRGHVRLERAPRASVEIEGNVSDPKISLRITQAEGRLQVRDYYPVKPAWFPMHECLPPPGEHGDFADDAGEVELVVRAPADVAVHVRVLAEY
jgi:hypothetical protein